MDEPSQLSPKHVQFTRNSRPSSLSLPHSRQNSDHKSNADLRRGRGTDLIETEEGQSNEASPLLRARTSEEAGDLPLLQSVISPGSHASDRHPDEKSRQETKSSWYLMLLTLGIGG